MPPVTGHRRVSAETRAALSPACGQQAGEADSPLICGRPEESSACMAAEEGPRREDISQETQGSRGSAIKYGQGGQQEAELHSVESVSFVQLKGCAEIWARGRAPGTRALGEQKSGAKYAPCEISGNKAHRAVVSCGLSKCWRHGLCGLNSHPEAPFGRDSYFHQPYGLDSREMWVDSG